MNKDIKQTVGLPCFNAKKIGFLAMEGLVAQKDIDWNWELLVIEEQNENMLGEQFFDSYREKLLSVNCVRIEYIKLSEWMPLGQKWKVLGAAASPNSVSFLLHAIDCLSFNTRLSMSQKLVKNGADWVDFTRGYFYSFVSNSMILYDTAENPLMTNLNMAIQSSLMRKLPDTNRKSCVDSYLYKYISSTNRKCRSRRIDTLFDSGFDSDGYNLISKRQEYYSNPTPPFCGTKTTINDLSIPKHVKDWIINGHKFPEKPKVLTRREVMLKERRERRERREKREEKRKERIREKQQKAKMVIERNKKKRMNHSRETRQRILIKKESHTRINQINISPGVKTFAVKMMNRFSLIPVYSNERPVVQFGMYYDSDYSFYVNHKGLVVVVWCGGDSMEIDKNKSLILQSRPDAIHYAMGSFIGDDLAKAGIPHTILPVTPTSPDIDPEPRGDAIYCYGLKYPEVYNIELAQKVAQKTGHKIILTDSKTLSREELMQAYKDSFIGLRLTKHDGLPNTVLELGMMGRRCVYNGDIPHSIKWNSFDDICETVQTEYKKRHEPNKHISDDIKKYISISDDWLNVK